MSEVCTKTCSLEHVSLNADSHCGEATSNSQICDSLHQNMLTDCSFGNSQGISDVDHVDERNDSEITQPHETALTPKRDDLTDNDPFNINTNDCYETSTPDITVITATSAEMPTSSKAIDDNVVVLGVWEVSPQHADCEDNLTDLVEDLAARDSDNLEGISDDSLYVELTDDEMNSASAVDGNNLPMSYKACETACADSFSAVNACAATIDMSCQSLSFMKGNSSPDLPSQVVSDDCAECETHLHSVKPDNCPSSWSGVDPTAVVISEKASVTVTQQEEGDQSGSSNSKTTSNNHNSNTSAATEESLSCQHSIANNLMNELCEINRLAVMISHNSDKPDVAKTDRVISSVVVSKAATCSVEQGRHFVKKEVETSNKGTISSSVTLVDHNSIKSDVVRSSENFGSIDVVKAVDKMSSDKAGSKSGSACSDNTSSQTSVNTNPSCSMSISNRIATTAGHNGNSDKSLNGGNAVTVYTVAASNTNITSQNTVTVHVNLNAVSSRFQVSTVSRNRSNGQPLAADPHSNDTTVTPSVMSKRNDATSFPATCSQRPSGADIGEVQVTRHVAQKRKQTSQYYDPFETVEVKKEKLDESYDCLVGAVSSGSSRAGQQKTFVHSDIASSTSAQRGCHNMQRITVPVTTSSNTILAASRAPQSTVQWRGAINLRPPLHSAGGVSGASIIAPSIPASLRHSSVIRGRQQSGPVSQLVISQKCIPQSISQTPTNLSASLPVTLALSNKVNSLTGKSLLEKYKAPMNAPPELFLPPPRRFICPGCANEFITVSGMQSHLSRKSMVLKFHCTCNIQKWPQVFYNPCSFSSFYKSHKRRPGSHASVDMFTASVLREDTPEYKRCCEEKKRRLETAALAQNEPQEQESASKMSRKYIVKAKKIVCKRPVMNEHNGNGSVDSTQGACNSDSVARVLTENIEGTENVVLGDVRKGESNSCFSKFFEGLECYSTACLECGTSYKRRKGLVNHYSHRGSVSSDQFVCEECNMKLPTKCALAAHLRIHTQRTPYVCPECGVLFDNVASFDVFMQHVKRVCLHFTRTPASTKNCPRCQVVVPTDDVKELARHMVDTHTVTYHKCQACPMAFSTAAAAERHSVSTGHNAQHRVVRKCPSCDAVFENNSSPDINTHVQNHLTSATFQCLFCSMRFSNRTQVIDHIRVVHPGEVPKVEPCEVCGNSFQSRKQLYAHAVANHQAYVNSVCLKGGGKSAARSAEPSSRAGSVEEQGSRKSDASLPIVAALTETAAAFECTRCQMQFESKVLFKRHEAKHRFLENKKAAAAGKELKNFEEVRENSKKVIPAPLKQVPISDDNSVACTKCLRHFPDNAKLDEHKTAEHGLVTYHTCYLCADCFSDADALRQHVAIRHTDKARLHAFVCPICAEVPDSAPRSFPHQGLLTKHLHSFHKISREEATGRARAVALTSSSSCENIARSASNSPSESVNVVKKLYAKGLTESYLCAQCSFSVDGRDEFVAHVRKSHPPFPADSIQCMECSQCFPVVPALHRHLRLVHHITAGIDDYLRNNGLVIPESVVDYVSPDHDVVKPESPNAKQQRLSPSTPTTAVRSNSYSNTGGGSPLECTVCYRLFFSVDQLRAHMRVHGMAFIQGTRRKQSASLTDCR